MTVEQIIWIALIAAGWLGGFVAVAVDIWRDNR